MFVSFYPQVSSKDALGVSRARSYAVRRQERQPSGGARGVLDRESECVDQDRVLDRVLEAREYRGLSCSSSSVFYHLRTLILMGEPRPLLIPRPGMALEKLRDFSIVTILDGRLDY